MICFRLELIFFRLLGKMNVLMCWLLSKMYMLKKTFNRYWFLVGLPDQCSVVYTWCTKMLHCYNIYRKTECMNLPDFLPSTSEVSSDWISVYQLYQCKGNWQIKWTIMNFLWKSYKLYCHAFTFQLFKLRLLLLEVCKLLT